MVGHRDWESDNLKDNDYTSCGCKIEIGNPMKGLELKVIETHLLIAHFRTLK